MTRFAPYVAPPLIFSTTACIDPFLSLILLTNTLGTQFYYELSVPDKTDFRITGFRICIVTYLICYRVQRIVTFCFCFNMFFCALLQSAIKDGL
jgi:hypothetical protein